MYKSPKLRERLYCRLDSPLYNLASPQYNRHWEERVFRLQEAGHCHTFNPQNVSHADMKGQTFLYLGEEQSGKTDLTLGFKIYLHERGQFWPSPALERLGQSQPVYLKTKTLLVGEFQLVERRILNTPARPCVEEERFSFTECMLEFIARRAGCHLDWVGTFNLPDYPPCQSLQQLEQYSDLLEKVGDFSWARLTKESGCYGKCRYKEYRFSKVED